MQTYISLFLTIMSDKLSIIFLCAEYGLEGRVSRKGHVYSYFILLLETFTRKKLTDIETFTGDRSAVFGLVYHQL